MHLFMKVISLISNQNVKFNMVLISHWSVYMFLSNFLKIKQIHKQIILFACDCYSILSQGVQISTTSEILYLILGNYKCNPWNCCVHYST